MTHYVPLLEFTHLPFFLPKGNFTTNFWKLNQLNSIVFQIDLKGLYHLTDIRIFSEM